MTRGRGVQELRKIGQTLTIEAFEGITQVDRQPRTCVDGRGPRQPRSRILPTIYERACRRSSRVRGQAVLSYLSISVGRD
jgi:hypothetical protein